MISHKSFSISASDTEALRTNPEAHCTAHSWAATVHITIFQPAINTRWLRATSTLYCSLIVDLSARSPRHRSLFCIYTERFLLRMMVSLSSKSFTVIEISSQSTLDWKSSQTTPTIFYSPHRWATALLVFICLPVFRIHLLLTDETLFPSSSSWLARRVAQHETPF